MSDISGQSVSSRAYLALTDVVDSPVTVRLVFAGMIDRANADWFAEYVFAALADFSQLTVQVDLHRVQSIDAAGLRSLLACHRRARAERRRFVIVNPSPAVRRPLQITGIADILLPAPDRPNDRLKRAGSPPQRHDLRLGGSVTDALESGTFGLGPGADRRRTLQGGRRPDRPWRELKDRP
jgi:stage II sporulation protein AA (anti-sigma F factor antagonist)